MTIYTVLVTLLPTNGFDDSVIVNHTESVETDNRRRSKCTDATQSNNLE